MESKEYKTKTSFWAFLSRYKEVFPEFDEYLEQTKPSGLNTLSYTANLPGSVNVERTNTIFAFHTEDGDAGSANLLVWGTPKVWLACKRAGVDKRGNSKKKSGLWV